MQFIFGDAIVFVLYNEFPMSGQYCDTAILLNYLFYNNYYMHVWSGQILPVKMASFGPLVIISYF